MAPLPLTGPVRRTFLPGHELSNKFPRTGGGNRERGGWCAGVGGGGAGISGESRVGEVVGPGEWIGRSGVGRGVR